MLGDSIVTVDGAPRAGVQIQFRWPGCAGYRYLQDGDIIVGVDEFSPVGVDRVRFVDAVKKCSPGSTLTFRILRQSRVVPIRVTLGARPAGEIEAGIETVMETWLQKEAVYWRKNFAPLVEESGQGAAGAGGRGRSKRRWGCGARWAPYNREGGEGARDSHEGRVSDC